MKVCSSLQNLILFYSLMFRVQARQTDGRTDGRTDGLNFGTDVPAPLPGRLKVLNNKKEQQGRHVCTYVRAAGRKVKELESEKITHIKHHPKYLLDQSETCLYTLTTTVFNLDKKMIYASPLFDILAKSTIIGGLG